MKIEIGKLYMFPIYTMYMFTSLKSARETCRESAWGPLSYKTEQDYLMSDGSWAYPLPPKKVFMVADKKGYSQYKIIVGDKICWINIIMPEDYIQAVS